MKKINVILITLNVISFMYVIYIHFISVYGAYHWRSLGRHSESIFEMRLSYMVSVALLLIFPLLIAWQAKRKIWILQFVFVLVFTISWKSDIMQKTLFYYSPTSTYRAIQSRVDFINKNERNISNIINYIEKEIGADTLQVDTGKIEKIVITKEAIFKQLHVGWKDTFNGSAYSHEEIVNKLCEFKFPPKITTCFEGIRFDFIYIENGLVKYCVVQSTDIPARKEPFYPPDFKFYPHGGVNEGLALEGITNYKSNFYLEKYCARNYYIFNDYWSFDITGKCFG